MKTSPMLPTLTVEPSLSSAQCHHASENLCHVAGNSLFEVAGLCIEGFEFLAQRFELCLEILIAHSLTRSHADVASGVERPPLRLDLLDRSRLAQTEHVGKCRLLAEDLSDLRLAPRRRRA